MPATWLHACSRTLDLEHVEAMLGLPRPPGGLIVEHDDTERSLPRGDQLQSVASLGIEQVTSEHAVKGRTLDRQAVTREQDLSEFEIVAEFSDLGFTEKRSEALDQCRE